MTQAEANAQVLEMLEQALETARRDGAIGCEVLLVHGDTMNSFRAFNAEAFADAMKFAAMQAQGGVQ